MKISSALLAFVTLGTSLGLTGGSAFAQSLRSPFQTQTDSNVSFGSEHKKLPESANENWFEAASAYVHDYEQKFHPQQAYGVFRAINSQQHLSMLVSKSGYTVENIRASASEVSWKSTFTIIGAGRGKIRWTPSANYNFDNNQHDIVYHFDGMDVEYLNSDNGIRQNFIVSEKIPGAGSLKVDISLESDLQPMLVGKDKLAFFHPKTQVLTFSYEDLKVWDANSKSIPAHLELDKNGKNLSIVVDDAGAVYPLTIDPLNRTPNWTSSADDLIPTLLNNLSLQVETLYGHTVTGLGDVNNDGYDDVAVGAPGMVDVVVGSGILGVGAVFVYFGSPAGLPTAPSKVLIPTTPWAGALFGFSVAGGDVTGDGINDIIVGAPLDRASVDFGGGNILNGTVGKVYLFQGGTLSGSNPSSLLSISLNAGLLNSSTIALNALYGFSVAAVDDMNGDGKGEILVGSPTYAQLTGAHVKTGGAFLYLSNPSNSFATPTSLKPQNGNVLGLAGPVQSLVQALPLGGILWGVAGPLLTPVLDGPIDGLLFGFSVSGAGRYDGDGINDVVVGAPAGVNLGTLTSGLGLAGAVSGVLSGQVLGGSAYVFKGTGTASGVNTTAASRLQASPSGLLSNAGNMFGYSVVGGKDGNKLRNGKILVGSPTSSVLSNVLGGLQVKAGALHVFKKQTGVLPSSITSDQALASPRANSILTLLTGQPINLSILYASSIDNMYDVNCDGIGDMIVGEPMSTSVGLLNANAVGGAAYVYLGKSDGLYDVAPVWDATATVNPLLGINATALIGHSVAGAGHTKGLADRVGLMVGGPSNSLDFGAGLLNLGNTMSVLHSFAYDNNGLGKAHHFDAAICPIVLPVTITEFTGRQVAESIELSWKTKGEENIKNYQVQRSIDGASFSNIGVVLPKSGALSNKYVFEDNAPMNGMNYYRLLITDLDGKTKYSQIINFRIADVVAGTVVIAPNPVKQTVRVRFSGIEKGTYRMEVRNASGQLFTTRAVSVQQSEQVEMFNKNNNMNSGIYWLSIYDKSNSRVKTIRMFVE